MQTRSIDTKTLQLTLNSESDRHHLSGLLSAASVGSAITVTIAPPAGAPAPSLPGGLARSFADAMREVETSYYNAV